MSNLFERYVVWLALELKKRLEITLGGYQMLMKGTTARSVEWPMQIKIQGGASWFDLLSSLYKVKGQ